MPKIQIEFDARWIVAIIGVAVVATITIVLWSRLTDEHRPRVELQATELRTSLIKLQSAISQGVSIVTYAELVLDTRTRFEAVRNDLARVQVDQCMLAITSAEKTLSLWRALLDWTGRSERAPAYPPPDEIFGPMRELGLVESHADVYELEFGPKPAEGETGPIYFLNEGHTDTFRKTAIGLAMSVVSDRLKVALHSIESTN